VVLLGLRLEELDWFPKHKRILLVCEPEVVLPDNFKQRIRNQFGFVVSRHLQDQHNFLVSQGMFRSWAIDVETLVTKRKQLFKRALQLAALRAFELWALIVFWNKKIIKIN
jgi:hypothetical protein